MRIAGFTFRVEALNTARKGDHMAIATLTPEQVRAVIPQLDALEEVDRGGQKVVYRAEVGGRPFALKLLSIPVAEAGGVSLTAEIVDEVVARAEREVEILGACQSPHVVKPGPLPLTLATIEGEQVAYFTEEWVDGKNIATLIREDGPLSISELVPLGVAGIRAIEELWSLAKIHRDIKPANIMRRDGTGEYVVLDMGLALDLDGDSLTQVMGAIPGTPIYFSPERIDVGRKRELDFRSDLFSLGIVLYEAATGKHPFWRPGTSRQSAVRSIMTHDPVPPSSHSPTLGAGFDGVCLRMLEKRAHLRFRRCDMALRALETLMGGGEE